MSRTTRLLTIIAALCAGFAILIAGCAKSEPPTTSNGGDPPSGVHLAKNQLEGVKTETIALTAFHPAVEATGTVEFDQDRSTGVLAPISGPVSRILVDTGTRVLRGTPLASIASPDFAAAVSDLRKAAATSANESRIAKLDRDLFENDAIARIDVENAETDAANATADLESARDQLRSLGVDEKSIAAIEAGKPAPHQTGVIRSPIDGTVVEKLITPGQLLEAGATPCFTVADLSKVWVMANVFETDLPRVEVGDPAEIVTESGAKVPAKVQYIDAIVDPATRAVKVRLVASNPGGVLKRDLYVRTVIRSADEHQGLLVPVSAVQRNAENLPYVFVTGPDDTFARRQVVLGPRIDDRQEVTSGLAAGETIVVEGSLFLEQVEQQ